MPLIKMAAERQQRQIPPGMQPPENAADWFRVTNSAEDADATDVFVYDSVGGWYGLYADDFIDALGGVTTSKINLRLNSPGGSVFEGITIANALRAHPANVTVYVDGLAASIASVIMLAGDRVVMRPQSQVMIHAASGACYGDSNEMTKMAETLVFQTRNIAEAYAERTGRSVDEFLDYMAAETWFTAKEAVALGLADEAMPMKPKQPETAPESPEARMHRSWDLSMYRYAGREKAPDPVAYVTGIDLSGDIANVAPVVDPKDIPGATPGTITVDIGQLANGDPTLSFNATTFFEMVRALVREEIADAAPPFLPKKGEDDPEEDDDDDEEEDEESQPDDSLAAAPPGDQPHVPEEVPPDPVAHAPETNAQADDWNSVVGLLYAPTSPSADDVFAQLKEGWN